MIRMLYFDIKNLYVWDMKAVLLSFIRFLENHNVFNFDVNDFDSRLRLQKYVFLARFYGLDMKYSFSLYIHGPYSPDLARDYYNLDNVSLEPLPESFRGIEFLELVKDKDEKWLEVAATIMSVYEYNKHISREKLIEIVKEIKPSFTKETIEKIIEDLEKARLLDF